MQIDEGTCQDIYYTACLAADEARQGHTHESEEHLRTVAQLLGLTEEETVEEA